jgi:regulator of sigma E protease
VTLTVAPNQVERIGLVFKMGPITAIQPGSPAESAGLRVGDQITTINDQAVGIDAGGDIGWDPSTLPYELPTADGDLTVTVIRAGETLAPITVAPRKVDWIERPESPGAPMPLPNLGLAYEISTEVQAVIPNSPADREKLQRGDRIVSALIEAPKDSELKASEKPIPFDDKASNWPYFFVQGLQNLPPGTTIELEVKRGNVDLTASVEAESVPGVYNPDRGLVLQPLLRKRPVASVGEAAALAWDRTVYSLSSVYRFLGKLGTQVSVTKLGGPGTIAVVAYAAATSGIAQLLLFLTMLSANLAVLNFLPIPVLDGGHMVFLVWEGVTGRPAGEKIVVALHAAGFVFLVGLMIFVFGLDISRFLSG